MNIDILNNSARNGTFGGTLLVLLFQLNIIDLFHTAIIAAVGAATSFLVSEALKYAGRKISGGDEQKAD